MDIDFIISEPWVRDINTINLNPNLASHAPNVSIIILIVGIIILFMLSKVGISSTSLNIMASRHNRDISRWVRWVKSAAIVI